MKKRATRRLGKHMSNIYFELLLMFYISLLHEWRLEIASWFTGTRQLKFYLTDVGVLDNEILR